VKEVKAWICGCVLSRCGDVWMMVVMVVLWWWWDSSEVRCDDEIGLKWCIVVLVFRTCLQRGVCGEEGEQRVSDELIILSRTHACALVCT
jgi:hypothetical protein